jgi:uncharacterized protein (TIGR02246 family)
VSSDLAAELEALERQGWEALSGPSGAAFYEELMADDGLMVFPGLVLDKRNTVRAIAGERPWARFELSDLRVTRATPDAALVTYRAVSQRGEEAEYRALMTTVYARRDGRWRLVLHQQTPLPGGG